MLLILSSEAHNVEHGPDSSFPFFSFNENRAIYLYLCAGQAAKNEPSSEKAASNLILIQDHFTLENNVIAYTFTYVHTYVRMHVCMYQK